VRELAEAVEGASVVLSIVSDDNAMRTIVDLARDRMDPGAVFVEASTVECVTHGWAHADCSSLLPRLQLESARPSDLTPKNSQSTKR
jgi:3-hydroxyisobutyrate dehydrogenase-like beta-hydroxyacid dehydrogenase